MTQETDEASRGGFSVDVDWLLGGLIQISVGGAAAAYFGQIWPEWSITIFLWGVIAVRVIRSSVSVERNERGREQLVFSYPWR